MRSGICVFFVLASNDWLVFCVALLCVSFLLSLLLTMLRCSDLSVFVVCIDLSSAVG